MDIQCSLNICNGFYWLPCRPLTSAVLHPTTTSRTKLWLPSGAWAVVVHAVVCSACCSTICVHVHAWMYQPSAVHAVALFVHKCMLECTKTICTRVWESLHVYTYRYPLWIDQFGQSSSVESLSYACCNAQFASCSLLFPTAETNHAQIPACLCAQLSLQLSPVVIITAKKQS